MRRTYLGWVRTATGVMVLGLAIAKFGSTDQAAAVGAGVIVLVAGVAAWCTGPSGTAR